MCEMAGLGVRRSGEWEGERVVQHVASGFVVKGDLLVLIGLSVYASICVCMRISSKRLLHTSRVE